MRMTGNGRSIRGAAGVGFRRGVGAGTVAFGVEMSKAPIGVVDGSTSPGAGGSVETGGMGVGVGVGVGVTFGGVGVGVGLAGVGVGVGVGVRVGVGVGVGVGAAVTTAVAAEYR